MRFSLPCSATILVATALAFGCDGDPDPVDAGPTPDAGPSDSGPVDAGPTGDGNDSFAEAPAIEIGTATTARIEMPGDLDYFTFEGTEGDWMIFATDANPSEDPDAIDTVITVYDSSMTQIAENDDALPRTGVDSEVIARLPSTGTYYVLVQEWSTWADDEPEGGNNIDFQYALTVDELAIEGAVVAEDAETGDDAASATPAEYNVSVDGDFGITVGTFEDGTDIDVFSFSVVAAKPSVQFTLMPSGPDGTGSSAVPASVYITNAAGDVTIARIDASQLDEIGPSLPEGDYLLWLDFAGTAGANDFYVLKGFRFTGNPPEMDELTNDLLATPEAIALEPSPTDATVRRGFILADLAEADTDHFSIDVRMGEEAGVFCGSRDSGSGIEDLMVEILTVDAAVPPVETVVDMGTETETEGVSLEAPAATADVTYIVRLTRGAQLAGVTGQWVQCGFAAAPPAAP